MMAETVERADVLDTLRAIVKQHQFQHVTPADGPPIRIDAQTANACLIVFAGLNATNQAKARRMMRTSAGLQRYIDFAWSRFK